MEKNISSSKGQRTGLLSKYLENLRNGKVAGRIPDNSSVLDIGCGNAALLATLKSNNKSGIEYVGVDIIAEVIENNKKQFPESEFIELNVAESSLDCLSHKRFDFITMIAIIEHFPEPSGILRKLGDCLKPEGSIILTTPKKGSETIYKMGCAIGLFSKEANEEHNDVFPDKKYISEIAENSGLKLTHYNTFLFGFNQLAILKKI